jgi:predicted ATPase/class 3 adenylate cyclase
VSDLPGGTLTFLFTDVEGSTRLWEQEPEAMGDAMALHDALFEETVERHAGVVVRPRGEGDSRFAVFRRASDSVAAASEFQQRMHDERWPLSVPLRVRAALHTGEAALRDGDYYGSAVNRCARLRGLAHGGQTLVSETTAQLVWEQLPGGVTLRDLGEHALKGLTRPERVFQLVTPGVPHDFPPLLSPVRRLTNLPSQTTTFVGRRHEIDTIRQRLLDPEVRLVTLIGPGGAGKTRLGLAVAEEVLDDFLDGVFFVPLANIQEPDLLIPTIAKAIGVHETPGELVDDTLRHYVRDKTLLIVLDNFDHLLDTAPLLVDLLSGCPQLKIMATSRETLHIRGNQEFSVPPLSLPDLNRLPPLDRLLEYEAIRLFRERARDIKADFELTSENAAIVAEICHRLDGLPLAIELAAARIRLFPPQTLLARLDSRLSLLTGGLRDLPAHQQTLRGTIAWSHDLLTPHEKALFRRLSVFVGGFTFDAAEAVVQLPGNDTSAPDDDGLSTLDVLNGLDSLVSKSLLHQLELAVSFDEPRFRMLETIREFGREQLESHGDRDARRETEALRLQHALFYLTLAEAAESALIGPDQGEWLERLGFEHANLRAAIEWSLAMNDAETGLRLTGALWPFWHVRGYFAEGRRWLERVLALGGNARWRAKALSGAGTMAWSQGDFAQAVDFHSEALALYEELGHKPGIAFALNSLGVQTEAQGESDRAVELYRQSLDLYRELGDELGIADALNNLGAAAWDQEDLDRAEDFYAESLDLRRKFGDHQRVADTLYNLGDIAYYRHDYRHATDLYQESLILRRSLRARWGVALCLAALAAVASVEGHLERAARLCGAAEGLFEETGISLDPSDRSRFEEVAELLRAKMGESAYASIWTEGQRMPEHEAIEYGLAAGDVVPEMAAIER